MYLKMYLAGNEKKVWSEIENLVVDELSESRLNEVQEVCKETMRRVKINTERIISALVSIDYDFTKFPDGEEHFFECGIQEADPEINTKAAALESIAGILPLTVKVFWETMGSISLVGYLSDWEEASDQLFVASVDDNLEIVEDWTDMRIECHDHAEDPYILYVSPDEEQKDNFVGAQYYNIELPCKTVDGVVKDAPSESSFVSYLREAFEAKGFPGVEGELPEVLKNLELMPI